MKKYILISLIGVLSVSCTSSREAVKNTNEKETQINYLKDVNSEYSTATVVGGAVSQLIQEEKDKIRKERIDNLINDLKNTEGVKIKTISNENEKSFDISVENDVFFEFDKAELTSQAQAVLSKLSANLSDIITDTKIRIVGHTDNKGLKEYNLKLSKFRAIAVGNFFRERGALNDNIIEEGKGFDFPIADNKTESGRAKNRRVEISIVPQI